MGHCRVCGKYCNSGKGFFGYELCGECSQLSKEEQKERRKHRLVEGRLETGLPYSQKQQLNSKNPSEVKK